MSGRELFENFTKEQVYKIGKLDGMRKVLEKLEKNKKVSNIINRMVEKEKREMDFATFLLDEGFYDS